MKDDFIYFEPLENGYLISIFQFEKLVIGNGSIEYTSYCLDDEGEPTIDKNDFMDFGKNYTLAEYEQLFKKRHRGRKLDKLPNGLYQLITKQWKRA